MHRVFGAPQRPACPHLGRSRTAETPFRRTTCADDKGQPKLAHATWCMRVTGARLPSCALMSGIEGFCS
jgi:hypothetical protein